MVNSTVLSTQIDRTVSHQSTSLMGKPLDRICWLRRWLSLWHTGSSMSSCCSTHKTFVDTKTRRLTPRCSDNSCSGMTGLLRIDCARPTCTASIRRCKFHKSRRSSKSHMAICTARIPRTSALHRCLQDTSVCTCQYTSSNPYCTTCIGLMKWNTLRITYRMLCTLPLSRLRLYSAKTAHSIRSGKI